MTVETTSRQSLDVERLRQDFPILRRTMHGKPLVYLDSAATSQKPRQVLETIFGYYQYSNANVHRGVYELAEEATAAYERARDVVAAFIGAPRESTIFVRNATEAINLVARTWGQANIASGDAILLTPFEHHSNLVPWQFLAEEVGARLFFADLQPDGNVDIDSVARLLATEPIKLVSIAYISNVLGTIVPIAEIARLAHDSGALILADGAQAVPHTSIDVIDLDVDFLAFTGHKMLGPMGIGVLYGRQELLEAMPPFLGGGEMIRHVELRASSWNDLPWKFEAGTPSVGDAVGLAAAVEYLLDAGMPDIEDHDRRLASYCVERLRELGAITIYGPEERGALVSFSVEDIHPHDLASVLDEQGVAIRAGHHCAQPLHHLLGVPATARASFHVYNNEADVDALIEGVRLAQAILAT